MMEPTNETVTETEISKVEKTVLTATTTGLPELIPLENDKELVKQHYFSRSANWVVPGKVMAGESPARVSVKDSMESVRIEGGVTTFVCLQAEVEPQTNDYSCTDYGGVKDGDEADILPSYADAARSVEDVPEPKFVYYGIRDEEEATSLQELNVLVEDLLGRIKSGEVLYIHCKGGTGRTGLVAASVLGRLYPKLSDDEILERTYNYCITRWKGQGKWVPGKVKSPATDGQVQQVREYLDYVEEVKEDCTCVVQ